MSCCPARKRIGWCYARESRWIARCRITGSWIDLAFFPSPACGRGWLSERSSRSRERAPYRNCRSPLLPSLRSGTLSRKRERGKKSLRQLAQLKPLHIAQQLDETLRLKLRPLLALLGCPERGVAGGAGRMDILRDPGMRVQPGRAQELELVLHPHR